MADDGTEEPTAISAPAAPPEAPAFARPRETSSVATLLVDLPRRKQADQRIAFRQAVAELARASADDAPSPLEGVRGEALAKGIGVALESGLFDDLEWLDHGAAGSALYQLAQALPVGGPQRELGRRVLSILLAGDASTFAAVATQMARAGGKGLTSAGSLARLALVVELPMSFEVADGALAFAIASRRAVAREFLVGPSTRSLPERRLAARLLERAAREALRRASVGDRSGVRLVGPEGPLEPVWRRLLADREPLVWRHVAVARGLLLSSGEVDPTSVLVRELGPMLSPTEWRRAAAAIGGLAVTKPDAAIKVATRALREGLLDRDRGAVAPFLWGLTRVAEVEPEVATELFSFVEGAGTPEDFGDAVLSLARELGPSPFTAAARQRAHARLLNSSSATTTDDGASALRAELLRSLSGDDRESDELGVRIDAALTAFAELGAKNAHDIGSELISLASGAADALVAIDADDTGTRGAMARRATFRVLRDLDLSVLERDVVLHLARLSPRAEAVQQAERAIDDLRDRVFVWLVERELAPDAEPAKDAPQPTVEHLALHLARLRALLHLVDSEAVRRQTEEGGEYLALGRFRDAARSLVACFARGAPVQLRRALMATFARCLDALARAGACDVSDIALLATSCLTDTRDLETLAEASMDPDTRDVLVRMAALAASGSQPFEPMVSRAPESMSEPAPGDSMLPPPPPPQPAAPAQILALRGLTDALAEVGSARSDAARGVVAKIEGVLTTVASAESLASLSSNGSEADLAMVLENAAFGLAQLFAGARARILDETWDEAPRAASRALSNVLTRALSAGLVAPSEIEAAAQRLVEGMCSCFAVPIGRVLSRLSTLPVRVQTQAPEARSVAHQAELPPWVPPRRVLGAFYVERPLAEGGAGSVFVVVRREDRHLPRAERFALKVPDYNANAARHLSEAQFLQLFRDEASALMALPSHESLARFVTCDLSARPKPILVMELVEGPNLERLLETRSFDLARAQRVLSQVGHGLAVMHHAGVGHLDLKPANVVLRDGETAVLVDFGLAGRQIRPGCGSANYSPPEVWGVGEKGVVATPMAADVYAYACLVFEALTGELLFSGESEVELLSQHIGHDGLPARLRALAQNPRFEGLAEVLFAALRRDPSRRTPITELTQQVERSLSMLSERAWPLTIR
ncbi:MAG: serine/threonine-protein kinase [Polyangiaceae bacterium]